MRLHLCLLMSLIAIAAAGGAAVPRRKPVIGIFPTLTSNGYLTAYKDWLAQEGADSIVLPERFTDPQQL